MNDLAPRNNELNPTGYTTLDSMRTRSAVLAQIAKAEERAEKFMRLKDDHQYWRDLAIENPSAWMTQRQQMNAERIALLQEGQQLHNKLRKLEQLMLASSSRIEHEPSYQQHRYPSYMAQLPPNLHVAARFS